MNCFEALLLFLLFPAHARSIADDQRKSERMRMKEREGELSRIACAMMK